MEKVNKRNVYLTGKEIQYIQDVLESGHLSGDGPFTKKCSQWIQDNIGGLKVLLTHSATAALEMSALLIDIQPGDEIIMPSYTFVSTANAFVLRGGIPVFVDIRQDTLNIDETLIEQAITPKTKAIVVVHYAGVGCEMDAIMDIAKRHNLWVIEDAAHGLMARYKDKPLGTLGHLGIFSFHETKNIVSGEGGALIINDERFIKRAEIIREKGTNRSLFLRGAVDKYTWVDMGSSYLPSELIAACLMAQLESAQEITLQRLACWNQYYDFLKDYESVGILKNPYIPSDCEHNAHIYYCIFANEAIRNSILMKSQKTGMPLLSHYVPLHSSPAGLKFARSGSSLKNTETLSNRLLRLPIVYSQTKIEQLKNQVNEVLGIVIAEPMVE